MKNVRITERKLTDGSTVTAIKFEATHEDATEVTVTLECNSASEAAKLYPALLQHVAYAETDATPS